MKLEAIVAALQRIKGSGRWKRIAQASETDYTTIARIARGDMPNPGVLTCERIAVAIEAESTLPEPAPDNVPGQEAPAAPPADEHASAKESPRSLTQEQVDLVQAAVKKTVVVLREGSTGHREGH